MTIRLRHYTRRSSKERILAEGRLIARDQNRVYVERAGRRPLGPQKAEDKYVLKPGKGNAYVEFDAEEEEVHQRLNEVTGEREFYLRGDVDLGGRNPRGFDNN